VTPPPFRLDSDPLPPAAPTRKRQAVDPSPGRAAKAARVLFPADQEEEEENTSKREAVDAMPVAPPGSKHPLAHVGTRARVPFSDEEKTLVLEWAKKHGTSLKAFRQLLLQRHPVFHPKRDAKALQDCAKVWVY
jgi:hypothetical protein